MGKRKKSKCFPDLSQQTASESTGGTLLQGPDLLDLIRAIKGRTTTTPTNTSSSTADENQDESKGMSRSGRGTLLQGPDLLALIREIKGTTTTTPTNTSSSTADENQDESKGMSRSELNTTLQMRYKASTSDIMDLPAWMQKFATKGTRKHYN